MVRKNQPRALDDQGDLRTDYALMALGIGAALVALVFLLST